MYRMADTLSSKFAAAARSARVRSPRSKTGSGALGERAVDPERTSGPCHVPDMHLQMCTHLGNLSESERRPEICQLRSEAVV